MNHDEWSGLTLTTATVTESHWEPGILKKPASSSATAALLACNRLKRSSANGNLYISNKVSENVHSHRVGDITINIYQYLCRLYHTSGLWVYHGIPRQPGPLMILDKPTLSSHPWFQFRSLDRSAPQCQKTCGTCACLMLANVSSNLVFEHISTSSNLSLNSIIS